MSKIVLELQRDAVESNSNVVNLLKKAYLVARKLKLKEFENWANNELRGYKDNIIPDYRLFRGKIRYCIFGCWRFLTLPEKDEKLINCCRVGRPISELVNICNDKKVDKAMIYLNSEYNEFYSEIMGFDAKFALLVSTNQLYTAIEEVKNIILDWTITLEENGILGENLEFSSFERECAKKNIIINNYINNFYSNVDNTQIQQDAKKSIQS